VTRNQKILLAVIIVAVVWWCWPRPPRRWQYMGRAGGAGPGQTGAGGPGPGAYIGL